MQFHVLSFEGPDGYARAGGIASRIDGLAHALADFGFETHLWFVGDPTLPGHERSGKLRLHRWCQWISRYHPGGVYDGEEGHGHEVFAAARAAGLRVADRNGPATGVQGLLDRLDRMDEVDVVNLTAPVDPASRRVLFRGSDAVLANSGHEPFGLVGLETMAAGGIACTGLSGEDYAVPGRNALVLQTGDPREFVGLFRRLEANPAEAGAIRRLGRATARHYAWPEVLQRLFLPRLDLLRFCAE